VCYYLLVVAAAIGLAVLRRRRAPTWILLTPIVMVAFTAGLTFGLTRFREPAELSIVILAAVGLDWIGRRVARRRGGSAGA